MKQLKKLLPFFLCLYLGGFMIIGSYGKFSVANPSPSEVIEKASQTLDNHQINQAQHILYLEGMKQSGYAWQVVGIAELLLGLLLFFRPTRWLSTLFLLPITLHIFLFHLFLEPDEIGELFNTLGLLSTNILLFILQYKQQKRSST